MQPSLPDSRAADRPGGEATSGFVLFRLVFVCLFVLAVHPLFSLGARSLGAGVLGESLGARGHSVLGQLPGQQQAHCLPSGLCAGPAAQTRHSQVSAWCPLPWKSCRCQGAPALAPCRYTSSRFLCAPYAFWTSSWNYGPFHLQTAAAVHALCSSSSVQLKRLLVLKFFLKSYGQIARSVIASSLYTKVTGRPRSGHITGINPWPVCFSV